MENSIHSTRQDYYPYFDYLRIVLASVVMFYHGGLIEWSVSGKLAVEVFFALSGWLIGGILLQTKRSELPRFYFNRAVRIWVPYYIALLLLIAASFLKEPVTTKWLEFVFYKLTWVYNLFGPPQLAEFKNAMPLDGTGNHFWSVNVEEQFYLLAPILLVVFPKFGRSIVTWIVIGVFLFIYGAYFSLTLGVIAAIINRIYAGCLESYRVRYFALLCLTLSTFLLVLGGPYQILSSIIAVSLVIFLLVKGKQNKLGAFLGGISYPLYLNHWIGLIFANVFINMTGLTIVNIKHFIYAMISYAIAALLYFFIDKPIHRKRKFWFSYNRGLLITVFAYFSVVMGLFFGLIIV